MFITSERHRARNRTTATFLFLLLVLLSGAMATMAQAPAIPDRGIGTLGSYSVSNIESVNLSNGNLGLRIPLASLPPIAGGKLSWTVNAYYSSKLINTHLREVADPTYGNYTETTLQLANEGGWKIGYGYSIRFEHLDEEYQVLLPDPNDPNYYELSHYVWKAVLTMPDGSVHELRPVDVLYSGGHDFNRGWYKDTPRTDSLNASLRYYSFDGSYVWARIDPFTTVPTSWTIYLPDGTTINQNNGIQRITDTNGNNIKIWTETAGSIDTTHYQDELTGREIKYIYNSSSNTGQVQYQTVNGTWVTTDFTFGDTYVHGKSYEDGSPCNLEQLFDASPFVVRSIVLPQTESAQPRQQFSFSYSSDTGDSVNFQWKIQCDPQTYLTNTSSSHGWGALSQIVTPSGATVNYGHSLDGTNWNQLGSSTSLAPGEGLRSKTVGHDSASETWTYNQSSIVGSMGRPDGSSTSESFYPHDPAMQLAFGGSDGKGGLVYRTNQSNRVLVERHWTRLTFSGYNDAVPGGIAVFNPVVDAEYTSLLESGVPVKMSAKTFQYDYNGNLLTDTDYDWFDPSLVSREAQGVPTGVPGSATVLRVINNTFYDQANGSTSSNVYSKRSLSTGAPRILNALQQGIVGPLTTQLSYDGQPYGYAPTGGNPTTKSVWDDVDSKWITSSNTYGLYGNLISSTDGRGKTTSCSYDDATHALPTSVTVDPQNGTGTQTTTTAYDYYTGLVISRTDPNGNTSTIDYTNQLLSAADPFGRPGIAVGPLVNSGGVNQHQRVKFYYYDQTRKVQTKSDLNSENDGVLVTESYGDQLGRTTETRQYEGASNYIVVQKQYDSMGRPFKVSNPYRPWQSESAIWTTLGFDLLARVTSVTTPDSAVVQTSYYGETTTVTDQTSKQRKSVG